MIKLKSLLFSLYLFTSCSTPRHTAGHTTENQEHHLHAYRFNLVVNGIEVPESNLSISTHASAKDAALRDTFVEIAYQKWTFCIRKAYLSTDGQNRIKYDHRLFNNSVKKELRKESLFFCMKYFILDVGGNDVYLIPVIKKS